jgi:hypothetical protein
VNSRPLAFVDIDGVLADVRHRLHHLQSRPKDWDAFFAAAPADPPHPQGIALVEELSGTSEVVLLTGRPERCRADTERWLARHGVTGHRLLMRPEGDRRPAAVVKLQQLRAAARGRRVAVVADDDPRVLEAMRAAGHPTRAVDWEKRTGRDDATLHAAQERDGRT